MLNPYLFSPPPNIYKRSEMLYDLLTKEENGKLPVAAVAKFLGMTIDSLRRAIQCGKVPFAFSSGLSERETSYISTDAFYNWIMQSRPYLIKTDEDKPVQSPSYIVKRINEKWKAEERSILSQ